MHARSRVRAALPWTIFWVGLGACATAQPAQEALAPPSLPPEERPVEPAPAEAAVAAPLGELSAALEGLPGDQADQEGADHAALERALRELANALSSWWALSLSCSTAVWGGSGSTESALASSRSARSSAAWSAPS
jgi:hypothetical protein